MTYFSIFLKKVGNDNLVILFLLYFNLVVKGSRIIQCFFCFVFFRVEMRLNFIVESVCLFFPFYGNSLYSSCVCLCSVQHHSMMHDNIRFSCVLFSVRNRLNRMGGGKKKERMTLVNNEYRIDLIDPFLYCFYG